MIITVEVEVALERPLKSEPDRISKIVLEIPCPVETHDDLPIAENYARLLAIFMATARPEVVMATKVTITNIEL